MEQVQDRASHQTASDKITPSLTPHELVERHMQHPDEPITDAEMENLNMELNTDTAPTDKIILTPEEKKSADELADVIQADSTGMSYKADI